MNAAGMPVTIGHPYLNGQPVSAKIAGKRVGVVRSPAIRNGRLKAEAVFDVAALGASDPALLRSLERGDRVEISTGLFTDNEPAPPGAPYDFIARNYRPDHLALLPDQQGACSVAMGCGVNNSLNVVNCSDACSCSTRPETEMSNKPKETLRSVLNSDHPGAASVLDPLFFIDRGNAVEARPQPIANEFTGARATGLDSVYTDEAQREAVRRENARRLGLAVEDDQPHGKIEREPMNDHPKLTSAETMARNQAAQGWLSPEALDAVLFGGFAR